MKKNNLIIIFLVLCFRSAIAQYPIKVKKINSIFLFYKNGTTTDTVIDKCKFTLLVPDSLKPNFSLKIANGRLELTKGDTLFVWHYLPGLNYELLFQLDENKVKSNTYKVVCLINGANTGSKNTIEFECFNKKTNSVFLKNKFVIVN